MDTNKIVEWLNYFGNIYRTDKVGHGYMEEYGKYLPPKCNSLLEIGVAKGSSLKLWNELYGTDCDIHCIDLFLDPDHVSQRWCRRNEFVPHRGDQSDISFLYTIREMFDVIIDDGSHRADHMQVTFKHLFINNLKSGGLYVIEDLGTCKEEFYRGSACGYENTVLYLIENYEKKKEMKNQFFTEHDSDIFTSIIKDVVLGRNKEICFIWKT